MRAEIKGLMYSGLTKKTTVEIEIQGNHAHEIEKYKEKDIDFVLKEYKEKRSLNANSYAWLLIGQLAELIDLPTEEIYRSYIKTAGVYQDVEINEKASSTLIKSWENQGLGWQAEKVDYAQRKDFVVVRLWYGSSVYNTKQMSRLINNIVQDCKAVDIETMTPAELAQLMNEWGDAKK